jgi:thiol-disulfide isomerase/thioredoxin
MGKLAILIALAAICGGVAFYHFHPDLSLDNDASSDATGPIAGMDQPLPQTVLASLDNQWIDLSKYKGQVVLVEFFATWCPGCVDETPSLIRMQQKFSGQGFTVIAIAIDDQGEETVESFVKRRQFPVDGASLPINFPVLLGSDEVARKLGFEGGLPAGVLVNRDGKEVKIIRGTVSEAALSKAIERLVKN